MVDTPEHQLRITFARRLRTARRGAKLTQDELADKIDRSVDLISRLERATTGPSLDSIARLASVLSVPASYFFEEFGEGRSVSGSIDELIDTLISMPEVQIEKIKLIIQALRD